MITNNWALKLLDFPVFMCSSENGFWILIVIMHRLTSLTTHRWGWTCAASRRRLSDNHQQGERAQCHVFGLTEGPTLWINMGKFLSWGQICSLIVNDLFAIRVKFWILMQHMCSLQWCHWQNSQSEFVVLCGTTGPWHQWEADKSKSFLFCNCCFTPFHRLLSTAAST